MSPQQPEPRDGRSRLSGALATVALLLGGLAAAGTAGLVAIPLAAVALVLALVRALRFDEWTSRLPAPTLSLAWLEDLARYVTGFVTWALPQIPFVAPIVVYVAVTWPLDQHSASLRFQEQASNIIPVLLIGYMIEAGALRWRGRRVDWILGLITVLILIAGETYALIDLATESTDHADIIAGAMAAGVTGLLVAAALGSTSDREAPAGRSS